MRKFKTMCRHAFALLLIIFSITTTFAHENDERFAKVDKLFEKWDKPNSPGCALAIVQDGEIIYKCGYGMADLEHNVAITPKTIFYIGSVSKQFVAMCILLLEEQGKLALDDDIRKFLPDFPQYDRPITIRHLVHHTSGIRDYLTLWQLSGKSYLDRSQEVVCRDFWQ